MKVSDSTMVSSTKSSKIPKRQIFPVVEIVKGYKNYGFCQNQRTILRRFSLNVYSAEIYALLGPHGCGKSTVLNVIMGITKLNKGSVKIFGFKPGTKLSGIPGIRVGYAPQGLGLYDEFTVKEALRYFGALHKLDSHYVIKRISFLKILFNLPHEKHFIKNCSKGHKCQISFAIALLHEPEVLILDEPTSGVDPLLRRNIWEHMKVLTKEGVTVLVTTQSCEEARLADKVGFMRFGTLLLEGDPKELLNSYKENHIDSLYRRVYSYNFVPLKTSSSVQINPIVVLERGVGSNSEGFIYESNEQDEAPSWYGNQTSRKCCPNGCSLRWFRISLFRICILILRNCVRAIRNYIWLFLFLISPAIFLGLFCITVGTTPSYLPMAVVNYEASQDDCRLNHDYFLSCQLLELIDTTIINQVAFSQESDAWDAANKFKIFGILVISADFTDYVNAFLGENVLNVATHKPKFPPMTLSLDFTNRIIADTIESTIKSAIKNYTKMATIDTELGGLSYPMKRGTPIFDTEKSEHVQYVGPGLALELTYHFTALNYAIMLVTDRINKITIREYLAGTRLLESVIADCIVYGFISVLQSVLLFCVLLLVFDNPLSGSILHASAIIIAGILSGSSFGIFVAMISSTSVVAGLIVCGSALATLILCGIEWPISGLPWYLSSIIKYLPQTQAIEAVRSILNRGLGLSHREVLLGLLIPLVWNILFTIGYGIFQKLV